MFEKVFYGLFETVAAKAQGQRKFRFKNKLLSLDSTVIDLCLSLYDWAKFRRTKGAVKLLWCSTTMAITILNTRHHPSETCIKSSRLPPGLAILERSGGLPL